MRDEPGYRAPQVCKIVGITYRQLDYWARTGLLAPSIRAAAGSGSQRLYAFQDIVQLRVVKRLLDAGMSLKRIRQAMRILSEQLHSERPLADVTLLSDGSDHLRRPQRRRGGRRLPPRPGGLRHRGRPGARGARRGAASALPGASPARSHRPHRSVTRPPAVDEFASPADGVDFAHQSEEQFARLLDFYGIDWEYEPRSFPIEFDAEGNPTGYFTPDFYLPDEDLFIEITTMNQKLVTKKNRKVRRLRALLPRGALQDLLPAGLPASAGQVRPRPGGSRGRARPAHPPARPSAGGQPRRGRDRLTAARPPGERLGPGARLGAVIAGRASGCLPMAPPSGSPRPAGGDGRRRGPPDAGREH